MAQNVVDFSDNPTGAQLMDDYLAKEQQNVLTSNSGLQRPSYAVAGTLWLNTSSTPWQWFVYDGTDDILIGTVNPTTNKFEPAGVDFSPYQTIANLSQTIDTSTSKYPSNNAVKKSIGVYTYSTTQTYNQNDVVISTVDDETALYKSLVNSNTNNPLTDDTKWEKLSLGGGSEHIGQVGFTLRTDVPEGCAWCDGAEYTKEMFPDVYQMLVAGKISSTDYTTFDNSVSTNGSCGFFGLDTSNERFKVPMLKDVYLKAGQAGEMFGAESLPNIKGVTGPNGSYINRYEGCFYNSGGSYDSPDGNNRYVNGVGFNASRSSSVYKDGAKVNPDHVTYRAYVVLYSSAVEASVAQAAEFMTGLAGKANTDLSNVSNNIDYVVESYNDDEGNWYRIYKSGWVEQGGMFLAFSSIGGKTGSETTLNLIKQMADTNYIFTANGRCANYTSAISVSFKTPNKTSSSVLIGCRNFNNGSSGEIYVEWRVCGQGAT